MKQRKRKYRKEKKGGKGKGTEWQRRREKESAERGWGGGKPGLLTTADFLFFVRDSLIPICPLPTPVRVGFLLAASGERGGGNAVSSRGIHKTKQNQGDITSTHACVLVAVVLGGRLHLLVWHWLRESTGAWWTSRRVKSVKGIVNRMSGA